MREQNWDGLHLTLGLNDQMSLPHLKIYLDKVHETISSSCLDIEAPVNKQ